MSPMDISQEEVRQLTDDIAYLQDEAEALRYVIDSVPVHDSPPGGSSIAEMLMIIDHAQCSYYRPIVEEARGRRRPLSLDEVDHYRDTFEGSSGEEEIGKMLGRLAKHRAGLVSILKDIPLIDWEGTLRRGEEKLTLFELMQEMVRFERGRLKEVADQVMVFNQDRQSRRQIEQRRERNRKLGGD